jgi:hypothetical protein
LQVKITDGTKWAIIAVVIGLSVWISLHILGPKTWVDIVTSQTALTVIVGAAGVVVSVITYIFQRRQLRLNALIQMFKEPNQPSHREARRVAYGEGSSGSYDLLGISLPGDGSTYRELERVSSDIFQGDINNAATLIYHGLMDEKIFLDEYWWIILRCWDTTKDSIEKRRASETGALSYMRNLKQLNRKAEKYARKHFKMDFEEYKKRYGLKSQG